MIPFDSGDIQLAVFATAVVSIIGNATGSTVVRSCLIIGEYVYS
jgi:hypothetical protein